MALVPVALVIAVVLAGCTQQQLQGWLPTTPGTTNHVNEVIGLWVTSWIVLLGVGIITWGLIIWAAVVYRRRKGDVGLPAQLRYNMPIEIFYTIVPLILVLGFFAFTDKAQENIEKPIPNPDVKIQAIGQRWAWTFNYVKENVYTAGVQAEDLSTAGGGIDTSKIPVLYLPVNKSVQIQLDSRDVIHSFWIIDFLYKKDMIPGKDNYEYFIPTKEGTYNGKCAELCGAYHAYMLFTVKVVSQAEYNQHIADLKAAGDVGQLGLKYSQQFNTTQELPTGTDK